MRSPRTPRWFIVAALPLVASGCALAEVGEGIGRVDGALFVRSCRDGKDLGAPGAPATYTMKPEFFVVDPVEDSVMDDHPVNRMQIRVQSTGNLPEEADVLWITIADVRQVAESWNQIISVGATSNVRASLQLNRSCRDREATPSLQGQIVFATFGKADGSPPPEDFQVRFGEKIAAQFNFGVVDQRYELLAGQGGVPTTPAVAGHLDGDFEMKVVASRSAQAYP